MEEKSRRPRPRGDRRGTRLNRGDLKAEWKTCVGGIGGEVSETKLEGTPHGFTGTFHKALLNHSGGMERPRDKAWRRLAQTSAGLTLRVWMLHDTLNQEKRGGCIEVQRASVTPQKRISAQRGEQHVTTSPSLTNFPHTFGFRFHPSPWMWRPPRAQEAEVDGVERGWGGGGGSPWSCHVGCLGGYGAKCLTDQWAQVED